MNHPPLYIWPSCSTKTALSKYAEEGQQWDVDFEIRDDVTIQEYLKMIEYKKLKFLVAAAMKMGAIIAQTSEQNANLISEFGLNLGQLFSCKTITWMRLVTLKLLGKQVEEILLKIRRRICTLKV
jgi:geranylgeranyl diphosphate synthase type II